MTNQEALDILSEHKKILNVDKGLEFASEIKAIDKSINALSAIEDIKQEIQDTINKDPECGMRFNPYYKAYQECLQIIDKHTKGETE